MIDIKLKSDFIIPFEKIGDENWEKNADIIITEFADNWEEELKPPISIEAIQNLEKKLNASLPSSLNLFYQKFGIANIGEELQDFDEIDWLYKMWQKEPEYGPNFTEYSNRPAE
ncbi:SMI1/KNR4 family protein [Aquimarina sp. 2201CG1-2-11]|uniref:SMI1/KNR4 family protein n=1 Tax=Aquimarina discodermiae TaxID=3231043 RepID=UPI003462035D